MRPVLLMGMGDALGLAMCLTPEDEQAPVLRPAVKSQLIPSYCTLILGA